ncbi:MAG TPA: hypothetical protein VNG33_01130 [Polyangiaceae bacterium]|nr:hypothetical protein [Polyangiaceae bacterium]
MKYRSRISNGLLRIAPAMLLTLLCAGEAQAAEPTLTPGSCDTGPYTYGIPLNTSVPSGTLPPIPRIHTAFASDVIWSVTTPYTSCSGSGTTYNCANNYFTLTLPSTTAVANTATAALSGATGSTSSTGTLSVQVAGVGSSATPCAAEFTFHTVANGTGWGDPHLTTVDGVQYDFQSAGEFTALREDGLEIQTRQSPVPSATVPITNEYTGITHCVAIYTAVAAKLGSTRVTVQPSPGAEPDPKSMQLRVNGKLVTLGDGPLIVRSETKTGQIDGTLTRHADGVIEITDARGTQLVVTPQYWPAQKVWYLNVNVYGTSAHEGTMGSMAERSWLPALPDGSSLGPKPASEADRYQALYEKFADAWRVTDATSLFDYKDYPPGTNTATYTRDEWPRNHPQSCAIEGQTSVQAATDQVAQQACANVADPKQRVNCVFDVKITGNTEFGKSYEIAQRFKPRAPGWYTPSPPTAEPPPPKCPPTPTPTPPYPHRWCCWPLILLGILQLILLIVLVARSRKKP